MVSSPARKLNDSERRRQAEEFVSTCAWKLLSSHGTSAVAGETPGVVMRIFAKGCPRHALRAVHEALARRATVVDPIIDGVVQPGTWYHKSSLWSRDEQKGESGQATFTVEWILTDGPSSEQDVLEDGCGSRTTFRFVWDAAAVEDVAAIINPATGSVYGQGFSVKLGGISKDPDSDLFSYSVSITEQKTKTLGELETGDDAFSSRYSKTVTGMRGTIAAPVTDLGAGVAILSPADQPKGTQVDVSWELNQDNCSLNARSVREVAKPNVVASDTCAKTLFSETDSHNVQAAAAALGHAPAAANGISTRQTSQLRKDELFDTARVTETELPVLAAEVTKTETLSQRQTRTTDKSQPVAESEALVPSATGGVITSVHISKTQGDLRDVAKGVIEEKPVASAEVSKSVTLFQEQTRATDKSQPVTADLLAPSASGGVLVSLQIGKTEGDLRDVSTMTSRELPVLAADVSKSATLYNTQTGTSDKSQPIGSDLLAPSATGGKIISYRIGKTQGDLRDVAKTESQELPVASAEVSLAVDAFHSQSQVSDKSQPVASDSLAPSVDAGTITSYRIGKTQGDLRDVTKSQTVEIPVAEAEVVTVVTPFERQVTTSGRSMPGPVTLASGEFGRIANSVTPGKLTDTSKTVSIPTIGAFLTGMRTGNEWGTVFEETTIVAEKDYGITGLTGGGTSSASIREVLFTAQADGVSYRKTVTVKTPAAEWVLPRTHTVNYFPGSLDIRQDSKSYLFSNATNALVAQYTDDITATAGTGFSVELDVGFGLSLNEFGLWSGVLSINTVWTRTTEA
jgi:hypothetical protein